MSIDAIHKETRISRSLIESFERGGLYDHPTFNEVYLRSFVRACAKAIDLSSEAALEGLDAALEGTYENALADRYLGSAPDDEETTFSAESDAEESDSSNKSDRSPASPAAGGPEGRGGLVGPPRALGEEGDDSIEEEEERPQSSSSTESSERPPAPEQTTPSEAEAPSEEESSPSASDADSETDTDETFQEKGADSSDADTAEDEVLSDRPSWMEQRPEEDEEEPSGASPTEEPTSPEPALGEEEGGRPPGEASGETGIVGEPSAIGGQEGPSKAARPDAAAVPDRGSRRGSGWRNLLRGERQEILWAGVGIAVIILVLVGLGVAYFSASSQQKSQTAAAPDTAASPAPEDTATVPPRPPPANVTLGDNIHLTVLATSRVSDLRIQRDDDLQRPYWIEGGDAEVFPFQERVILENELGDIRLFLAGYPYPNEQRDTTGQIVITRSQVEAFVDTLRGAPATFSVTPDTIPKGPPSNQ